MELNKPLTGNGSGSIHHNLDKVSAAGLLVALGIIYGDIGTSPLYVLKAIAGTEPINQEVIYGALSCIFWTLTMQTTVKYVILTLRADNKGEGGILALFALVRRHAKWLTVPAIIGASALLADGIITPPISVTSAIEGLRITFPQITPDTIVKIVLVILSGLFLVQILGTKKVGFLFGPLMFLWFGMLATLGFSWIIRDATVLKALNPYYAYKLLVHHPGGFWLLGAVFLCTTGAEALYSDLGHCGRGNIRISWIFVKLCLILNYLGQGVYVMQFAGQKAASIPNFNPFYGLMPEWFLPFGIVIATSAAIIASQALISGSFTLVSEAIRLNFWPKIKINYPSDQKGQLYVPSINILLWIGCLGVELYFFNVAKERTLEGVPTDTSSAMEAAYGLAITLTMLMTTMLMSYYLYAKKYNIWGVLLFMLVYFFIEGAFLIANLEKFPHGGYVSLIIGGILALIMYIWIMAFNIKMRLTEYEKLDKYVESLQELSNDITVPKYATHLVFLSNASRASEIENKIIYSIFQKRPKRADVYWFVHVDTLDDPYTMEYKVKTIAPDDVYKVNFRLGFRVPHKVNLYFKKVLEDMVKCGEVDIRSRYESLNKHNVIGDFRFVVLEKFLSYDNQLPFGENLIMKAYFFIKEFTPSEDKWFGLDSSSVKVEKVPLVIRPAENINLKRVPWQNNG
ncbi:MULTISPECIES: KUP/HAK/KT family potassium transporter [Emticicia]|uniref:KUP/HAK/KT family potassium transporter n=1 Tax=Emticicia TaxID=312278 RepID=UPI000C75B23A|nr:MULTISPECIES: KUP/HAK/KT family potassium transporter [Emticicia]PLK46401.1 potassium transporter Kup [Emticicia sp. TH156]UTA68193.1 KUP/HAK/KT family potassium transporter [Emticicia sp. 21SJ11W-3]